MFYCAAGHVTDSGSRMFRVPVEVRSVRNEHVSKDSRTGEEKVVQTRVATEVVHEACFCEEHAHEATHREPRRSGSVVRRHVVIRKPGDFPGKRIYGRGRPASPPASQPQRDPGALNETEVD